MGSNEHTAIRFLISASLGGFRPFAVTSQLNILLIILVNLLVLGLINLA